MGLSSAIESSGLVQQFPHGLEILGRRRVEEPAKSLELVGRHLDLVSSATSWLASSSAFPMTKSVIVVRRSRAASQ